ncbi:MAG: hypothetical protein ABSD20_07410 [Terriglobales bacterium]|jgi:hypothetical protein
MPLAPAVSDLSLPEIEDFSLVIGGPFYKLLLRLGLGLRTLPNIQRRAVAVMLITWVPLAGLALAQGVAFGKQVQIPLFYDLAVYGRFLICVPLWFIAEAFIDPSLNAAVQSFVKSGLVRKAEMPDFLLALEQTARLRDAVLPEVLLAVLACAPTFLLFEHAEWLSGSVSTWRSTPAHAFSWAGWWFAAVSTPIARFIMYRWLWRFLLWAALLRKLSRINLHLLPTHPDYVGGLGFLPAAQERFAMLFTGLGAVLAGHIANEVLYEGQRLADSKVPIYAYIAISVVVVMAPLLVFTPALYHLRRTGLVEYGRLANRYMAEFDEKWIHGRVPEGEPLLGTNDVQSQADLGASYSVIRGMHLTPISKADLFRVALAVALPMVPLVFIATPVDKIVQALLKMMT